ncbi:MAG TPA: class I SAM-dependent methyltransferase [Burkholderiales bacterium]|nr:class I SAM-dependent methyltransferase [Burkholderiales bacterium]
MQFALVSRRVLLATALTLCSASVLAQAQPAAKKEKAAAKAYEPTVGQEGKDVVWVPTSQGLVNRMLDMAKLTASDVHFDLGSGDGRTVITAAKRGANATGVEYNPDMVALSRRNAQKEGMGDKAKFIQGDIFETDFSKATVITLFLLPELNVKLRPKILDMKPGTRVVSNSFTMGDWQADSTQNASEKDGCTAYCTAYLWIVPAKVEGTWKLPEGELVLKQTYQNVTGTLNKAPIKGTLRADEIKFTAGKTEYTAKVSGDTMTGTAKGGGSFTATRTGS